MSSRVVLAGLFTALSASVVSAQDHHDHPATVAPPQGIDHQHMDHGAMGRPGHGMSMADHGAALGPYPTGREASGTAWQPDTSPAHGGLMVQKGDWMLMGHAVLNGVYDRQEGPRGDDKAFVSGMIMGMARRPVGAGTLQLRAMLSPDPVMGERGYPLLLASGETADGVTPLVDRQHPHDAFMELSGSYSAPVSEQGSVYLYAGLPGEPAFGPPAFMHRASIQDSPEAPISHHWLDSTHITFGVLTAGWVQGSWKVEASRFRGREPDERRWNIETGDLDSTAARLSWNPHPHWSLQASWADVKSPEALDPDENATKWSASGIYTRPLADGWWSTTAAWGRKGSHHGYIDAFVLESAVKPNDAWTIFARAEQAENDELSGVHHGPAHGVSKVSLGAVRDFAVAPGVKVGLGALVAKNFVPAALQPSYGGDPAGGMAFVRLKIG